LCDWAGGREGCVRRGSLGWVNVAHLLDWVGSVFRDFVDRFGQPLMGYLESQKKCKVEKGISMQRLTYCY
jgi:hypothetical protein